MNSPHSLILAIALRLALKRTLARRVASVRNARRARNRIAFAARWLRPPAGWCAHDTTIANVPTRVLTPDERSLSGRVLYFHGGGFYVGTARAQTGLLWRMGRAADATVVAPDYRLAPEHPWPAALDDAFAVYSTLLAEGTEPTRIAVGGDSAGGNLALALLLRLRDAGRPLPAAAFAFSPWTDLTGSGGAVRYNARRDCMLPAFRMTDAARLYAGSRPLDHPLVSPLFAALDGLPPLQLHVSSTEILLDDTLRLADRARAAGVPTDLRVWQRLPHGFPVFADILPEARQAIDEVGGFIRLQYPASTTAAAGARPPNPVTDASPPGTTIEP